MVAIGESATAFVFIFVGIANQLPWLLCATVFMLNDLPFSRLSNNLFSFLYITGLCTSVITGVANAMLWTAGADVATSSPLYISLFTFTVARIVLQCGAAIAVKRKLMRTPSSQQSFLMPTITTRLPILVALAWVTHLVEGVLVACIPATAHLIDYTPLYLYIPGFVAHSVFTGVLAYCLLNAPRK